MRHLIWENIASSPLIPREEPTKKVREEDARAVSLEAARLAISSWVLFIAGETGFLGW